MHAYIFQVDYNLDGVMLRRWVDASNLLTAKTKEGWDALIAAKKRMGLPTDTDETLMRETEAMLACSKISERFSDAGGTFLVKTEDPLTAEELKTFLDYKRSEGELSRFLSGARI